MTVVIIQFPGSNRDQDMIDTVYDVMGKPPTVVWHAATEIPDDTDCIILPGGFSYGDYLRCGAIAARAPVMAAVLDAAKAGVPVFGVCNGFQILIEAGLLPGALMPNATLRFVCKTVQLRIETARSPFLSQFQNGEQWACPVAHGDGNYVCSADTLKQLQDEDRIALTYARDTNPNGSMADIAGITNRKGNVLGMMPHPENAALDHHDDKAGRRMMEGLLNLAA